MSVRKELRKPDFLFVVIGALFFILGGYWYGLAFSQPNPSESPYYVLALSIIIGAIGVEVYYFLKFSVRLSTLEKNFEDLQKNLNEKLERNNNENEQPTSDSETDPESLRLEYQSSQQLHIYYGKIVWQIGAIFLPVSLGGFAFGIQQQIGTTQFVMLAGFLTTLLAFFLLSYWRLRWLAHLHAKRCEEIEKELGMQQFTLQRKASKKTIKIGGEEFNPQPFTSYHINSAIPLILIGIIWIYVAFQIFK